MRNLVDRQQLRELVGYHHKPCVSVYAPTHAAGVDTKQDPIRAKNLLGVAEDKLAEMGVRSTDARALLRPARELLDDRYFWTEGGPGVAMFISPEDFRALRVPFEIAENVVVNSRYHLSPLMPLLVEDNRFYVLALSRERATLYQATPTAVRPVDLGDTPMTFDDALRGEEWDDRSRSWHSSVPSPDRHARGGIGPVTHGKGDAGDYIKNETLRYFQALDKGVAEALKHESAPLVVACVEYEFPLWEKANSYKHLVTRWVDGNPDLLHPNELRDKAWAVASAVFQRERAGEAERLREFRGTGRASEDIAEVAASAYYGRVDSLFVSANGHHWGRFDADTGKVEVHDTPQPGDEPLADFAAVHTFLNDGKVWVLPDDSVMGGAEAVALYRYAAAAVY